MNGTVRLLRNDRARPGVAIEAAWDGVSGASPCPICGCDSRCLWHSESDFVCCARRPSEWPLTNGGWLHRVAHGGT